jgi:hypothetical protein
MALPTPGEARIRSVSINGMDLTPYVYELSINESIFKPFRSAELVIIDNNNIAKQLKLQGNEDIRIAFDSGSGKVYEAKMKVVSPEGGAQSQNMRFQGFKLNAVSESFFKNKTTTVQKSFKNITGTDAIKKIHDEYKLGGSLNMSASKGFIGENEPYIISNQNPFDAIQGIRTRITSDKYKTGAYAYFEDAEGNYTLKPLEELFDTLKSQADLTHKPTMGENFRDMYAQGHNIIGFQEGASFNSGSRFDITDVLNSRKSAKVSTFDTVQAKYQEGKVKDPEEAKKAGYYNIKQDQYGNEGPRSTTLIPHDKRLEKNSVQAEKSAYEQRFIQEVKNGPSCTVQVMIDSGLKCTVGKGVNAKLSEPIGDMSSMSSGNPLGGDMMVVNLKHTIKMTGDKPRSTTTMELAKGGYNKGTS